ncbi:precorrin-6A synthase (deacetylating) [Paractinoplanes brasiliensis]|uniref:precorrin-6A synthase (deacetylating) n=1 Tax=Paractinoplanes brasiliensis TaxID=52695 RepID=UPI001060398F|nr:precorrin-6A synthase (deacetylating) [Actinoplanes brasiliensis]
MRKIFLIGLGAGDPDHLTLQAAKAIGRTDVFFLLDDGEPRASLADLRERIVRGYSKPSRRTVAGRSPADSQAAERMLAEHLKEDETGSFLVWGDPTLYDLSPAILEEVLARGTVEFEYEVIPGISSVSALAAKHRVPLNRFQVMTGRQLAEGWPEGVDELVVLHDEQQAFAAHPDADIFWGAYVGTPDEILRSGRVSEVAGDIAKTRADARTEHGWILDTYLLRRPRAH